jgi:hypothetical protein
MRAARYHGVRDVRIKEVPEPEAGPGQVKAGIPAAALPCVTPGRLTG